MQSEGLCCMINITLNWQVRNKVRFYKVMTRTTLLYEFRRTKIFTKIQTEDVLFFMYVLLAVKD